MRPAKTAKEKIKCMVKTEAVALMHFYLTACIAFALILFQENGRAVNDSDGNK